MRRFLGILSGFFFVHSLFHEIQAHAFGFKASTLPERLGAVAFGVLLLGILLLCIKRWMNRSFYHGFLVATGLFLSFDIVVFHWIFQLHRITSGPEANVLEPVLVAAGCVLLIQGWRRERTAKIQMNSNHPNMGS